MVQNQMLYCYCFSNFHWTQPNSFEFAGQSKQEHSKIVFSLPEIPG